MSRKGTITYNFAVVICKNEENKFLAVKETDNRGWWLPAGRLEEGETFEQAALRETKEEALIDIKLKGILRVERSVTASYARMRVVFFATPSDPNQKPKDKPDKESEEARWITKQELFNLEKTPPGLRGDELKIWIDYLDKNGPIFPFTVLSTEYATPEIPDKPVTYLDNKSIIQPEEKPNLIYTNILQIIQTNDLKSLNKFILNDCDINMIIDDKQNSILNYSIQCKAFSCMKNLILYGSSIHLKNIFNQNSIHILLLSKLSNEEILSSLKLMTFSANSQDFKNSLNSNDEKGNTPLHYVAEFYGEGKIWNYLIKKGADKEIKNLKNLTSSEILKIVKN